MRRRLPASVSPARLLGAGAGIAVLVFMLAPLAILLLQSFSNSTFFDIGTGSLTLRWYSAFFADVALRNAMLTSVEISACVTVVSLAVGVTSALAYSHLDFPGKHLLQFLVFLPGIMPWLLLGVALNIWLAFLLPGATGILPVVVGQVTLFMPFAFFITLMGTRGVDAQLELAAIDLGASFTTVLRKVTLPLITPWIVGAALIVFPLSFNELIVTSLLITQGATLPIFIYSQLRAGITPEVNAVAGVLVLSTILLGLGAVWTVAARSRWQRVSAVQDEMTVNAALTVTAMSGGEA